MEQSSALRVSLDYRFLCERVMRILITGVAGFIGFHLARKLIERGDSVLGLDNLNDYYDVSLKRARLKVLERSAPGCYRYLQADIAEAERLNKAFHEFQPDVVVNLAAQAGVRYSLENPAAYVQSNLVGFANLLECCRQHPVKHLVYASSSSVYGMNRSLPYRVEDNVDHPVSLYAATKKSNELMAHAYSHLYGIPATGLRFFTVYGPWGRPDMAPHLFASAILEGRPIRVFNQGKMERDFTFIDDIVSGVVSTLALPPQKNETWDSEHPNPADSSAPWRVLNIGNHQAIPLMEFIETLENALGRKAEKIYLPMQPGDVQATYADTSELTRLTGFTPHTSLKEGIGRFVAWHLDYYGASHQTSSV